MPEIRQNIRTATIVVAANDSLHKNMADYVCDGTADDVEIQAALDALPAGGGKVVLLEGEYSIASTINLSDYQTLEGQGFNTILRAKNGFGNYSVVYATGKTHAIRVRRRGLARLDCQLPRGLASLRHQIHA